MGVYIILIKTVIIALLVFFVLRLMGKRQIGEMQPFEFVITLLLAEVACLPMNDPYMPIYSGIIPIVVLAFLNIVITFIARKSFVFRRAVDGHSVIIIDKQGLVYNNIKKLNMNVDDVIESVRSSGYPDLSEVAYAIIEPNGKLSIIEQASDPCAVKPSYYPLPLIVDGKRMEKNMQTAGVSVPQLTRVLLAHGIKKEREVLYLDIRQDGTVYVSPKQAKCYTEKISISGGKNW